MCDTMAYSIRGCATRRINQISQVIVLTNNIYKGYKGLYNGKTTFKYKYNYNINKARPINQQGRYIGRYLIDAYVSYWCICLPLSNKK